MTPTPSVRATPTVAAINSATTLESVRENPSVVASSSLNEADPAALNMVIAVAVTVGASLIPMPSAPAMDSLIEGLSVRPTLSVMASNSVTVARSSPSLQRRDPHVAVRVAEVVREKPIAPVAKASMSGCSVRATATVVGSNPAAIEL